MIRRPVGLLSRRLGLDLDLRHGAWPAAAGLGFFLAFAVCLEIPFLFLAATSLIYTGEWILHGSLRAALERGNGGTAGQMRSDPRSRPRKPFERLTLYAVVLSAIALLVQALP